MLLLDVGVGFCRPDAVSQARAESCKSLDLYHKLHYNCYYGLSRIKALNSNKQF